MDPNIPGQPTNPIKYPMIHKIQQNQEVINLFFHTYQVIHLLMEMVNHLNQLIQMIQQKDTSVQIFQQIQVRIHQLITFQM